MSNKLLLVAFSVLLSGTVIAQCDDCKKKEGQEKKMDDCCKKEKKALTIKLNVQSKLGTEISADDAKKLLKEIAVVQNVEVNDKVNSAGKFTPLVLTIVLKGEGQALKFSEIEKALGDKMNWESLSFTGLFKLCVDATDAKEVENLKAALDSLKFKKVKIASTDAKKSCVFAYVDEAVSVGGLIKAFEDKKLGLKEVTWLYCCKLAEGKDADCCKFKDGAGGCGDCEKEPEGRVPQHEGKEGKGHSHE